MTNLATPARDVRPVDVDALEAAFRLPSFERERERAFVADAHVTGSSTFGEGLVFTLFASVAIGGLVIVAQSLLG